MSQTETHFGKLRRVVFQEGQTLEDWCKAACNERGETEKFSYCKTWYEQLRQINDEEFYFVKDEVWETIEDFSAEEGDDIYQMHLNEDGTVTYVMQFYNGGTCLSECLEESLARMERPVKDEPNKDMMKCGICQQDFDMSDLGEVFEHEHEGLSSPQIKGEVVKDLEYWKNNAEEDYLQVPISVLKYISELEKNQEGIYTEEETLKFAQLAVIQCKVGNTNIGQMKLLKETLQLFKKK
jgi:hypothetical protein